MPDEKKKCFVLMPFEAPREKYYAQIFSRAIEDAGLTPRRGDSLFRSSPIMGDIWKFVQESTVLLADLTGRNANVFYELGLAHAISKPVVLVAETMDDVPFDLRGLRVLMFDRHDPDWGATLRERIANALKETLADILGAVPSMFVQRTTAPPSSPTETALEGQVRSLAEEITALRREFSSRTPNAIAGHPTAFTDVLVLFTSGPTDAEVASIAAILNVEESKIHRHENYLTIKLQRPLNLTEELNIRRQLKTERNVTTVLFGPLPAASSY